MNWKWPKNEEHPSRNPWFVILRRLIFAVPLIISMVFFWAMVVLFSGWDEACDKIKQLL